VIVATAGLVATPEGRRIVKLKLPEPSASTCTPWYVVLWSGEVIVPNVLATVTSDPGVAPLAQYVSIVVPSASSAAPGLGGVTVIVLTNARARTRKALIT